MSKKVEENLKSEEFWTLPKYKFIRRFKEKIF